MKVSYYPGCSLNGTAKEFGESVEGVAKFLSVELTELPDWTCCGSSSAHHTNDDLAIGLTVRNLEIADKVGLDVVVPCALCFSRFKIAEKEILAGHKVPGISSNYSGKISIKDSASFFWKDIGEEKIRAKIKKPLDKLNPVCYYGCLTSRPPKSTDAERPEDPQYMDNLVRSLGANVKNWSYKTDCCGGSLILSLPEIAYKLVQTLLDMSQEAGADCIVVACPMCGGNLDMWQKDISLKTGKNYNIPIFYFTELMGLAFGEPLVTTWLSRHHTNPMPFLKQKGLI